MSVRTRDASLLDVAAAFYAALAAFVGLAALVLEHSLAMRGLAGIMLAALALGSGRMVVLAVLRMLVVRRERSLGASVDDALATLDDRFRVTRARQEGVERQDHVVVGPNGVFVIVAAYGEGRAARAHRRLLPDRRARWRDLIDDCHIEALRAGERLRRGCSRALPVHPIVCVGSGLVSVGREVRGVRIVPLGDLVRTIDAVPLAAPLDARAVAAAAAALTTVAEIIPLRPRSDAVAVPPARRNATAHHRPTPG
jgi:hypothetical protein